MLDETNLPKLPASYAGSVPRVPLEENTAEDHALGVKDPAESFESGQSFDDAAAGLAARLDNLCKMGTAVYRPIAICGCWGSGKTSFAHRVINNYHGRAQVVFFDPWMFSSKESLFEQFFRELSVALGDDGGAMSNYGRAFLDVLGSGVFDFLIEGGKYKGLGGGLANVFKSLRELDRTQLFNHHGEIRDLVGAKRAIEKQLAGIDYKLIVVVDNIDRLDPKLTTLLFQFLGTIVDLPNILYLLLFDQNVVSKALEKELGLDEGSGDSFLDKIVYLRLDLPSIALSNLVQKGLVFDKEFPTDGLDNKKQEEVLKGRNALALELSSFLDNPRTVHAVAHAYQTNRIFEDKRPVLPNAPISNTSLRTTQHNRYLLLSKNDDGAIEDFLDALEPWIDNLHELFPYKETESGDGGRRSQVSKNSGSFSQTYRRRVRIPDVSPEEKNMAFEKHTAELGQDVIIENDNKGAHIPSESRDQQRLQVLDLFATILNQAGIAFNQGTFIDKASEHIAYIIARNDYSENALDIPSSPDIWIEGVGLQLWFCLLAACRERSLRGMTSSSGSEGQDYMLGLHLYNRRKAEPGIVSEQSWELGPHLKNVVEQNQYRAILEEMPLAPRLFIDKRSDQDEK